MIGLPSNPVILAASDLMPLELTVHCRSSKVLERLGFAHAFPPLEIAAKIGVSLGIGLLVGLEREWAHKDLDV